MADNRAKQGGEGRRVWNKSKAHHKNHVMEDEDCNVHDFCKVWTQNLNRGDREPKATEVDEDDPQQSQQGPYKKHPLCKQNPETKYTNK